MGFPIRKSIPFFIISIMFFFIFGLKVSAENDTTHKEALETFKETVQDASEKANDVRERVQVTLAAAKEEMEKRRDESTQKIVNRFSNNIDTIVDHLNSVKEKILANATITEEMKSSLIADIDSHIATIQSVGNSVLNIEDLEDAKNLVNNIQHEWCQIRVVHGKTAGLTLVVKYKEFIKKVDVLYNQVFEKIQTYDGSIELSAIEAAMRTVQDSIMLSHATSEQVEVSLHSIDTTSCNSEENIAAVIDQLKGSKENLHNALQELRNVITQMRDLQEVEGE